MPSLLYSTIMLASAVVLLFVMVHGPHRLPFFPENRQEAMGVLLIAGVLVFTGFQFGLMSADEQDEPEAHPLAIDPELPLATGADLASWRAALDRFHLRWPEDEERQTARPDGSVIFNTEDDGAISGTHGEGRGYRYSSVAFKGKAKAFVGTGAPDPLFPG